MHTKAQEVLLLVLVVCAWLGTSLASDSQHIAVDPTTNTLPENVQIMAHHSFPQNEQDNIIERFRKYLQIDTVQPKPDYDAAVDFLVKEAARIGLTHTVLRNEAQGNKPTLIIEWIGKTTDKSKKSIMLNSHMDVVPVEQNKWKYNAFEAVYEKNTTGNIFARGSQDMKCVSMQYLEAIDILKNQKKIDPAVPVYVTLVPDEEIGGDAGMGFLVKSDYFKKMNVGFGLDEGLASENEVFSVYYGERIPIWLYIEAQGPPGHGSSFIENTATEKIARVISKAFAFRAHQEQLMKVTNKKSGDVVSINLTSMKAGHSKDGGKTFSMNVIPGVAQIGLDIRIPPTIKSSAIINDVLGSWVSAEPGLSYRIVHTDDENPVTDLKHPLVQSIFDTLHKTLNLKTQELIFPASTDARFVRKFGVPVIGFSPMNFTPILLHDHNEYLNDKIYLNGIDIYVQILQNLLSASNTFFA